MYRDTSRAEYVSITDDEALKAFQLLPHRGNHPRARIEPCHRARDPHRADDEQKTRSAGEPFRSGDKDDTPSHNVLVLEEVMNRIDKHRRNLSAALKAAKKSALIPFITAGDPSLDKARLPTMTRWPARVRDASKLVCHSPTRWLTACDPALVPKRALASRMTRVAQGARDCHRVPQDERQDTGGADGYANPD